MGFAIFVIPVLVLVLCQSVCLVEALVLPNFYPFGASEGDQLVPDVDDGSSGEVPISISFPFFGQNHSSLFINANGVISFLVQVSGFTPDAFPLGENKSLVAPFWADVDTRKGGQVFYQETSDPGLLQRATDDVTATYADQKKFRATWLLIATWYEVAFYGAAWPFNYKRNTFQAVLITNGRHSFVIFNYNKVTWTTGTMSGGDSSGLGGTAAQAGFNAGDGVRYFNIPGSRTNRVLDLPNLSNVAIPGRWMFRIDSAQIIAAPVIPAANCNTNGSLVVSPQSGIMLGGDNILISGPCYNSSHRIVCEFPGGKMSNGSYISDIRASCTVPMLNVTGRLPIKMSVNGGTSFDFEGIFTTVNINRVAPRVTRLAAKDWTEQRSVRITWDAVHLGPENQTVDIQLARFSMKDDGHVFFHSMYTLISDQLNTGEAQFTVPKGQGQGATVGSGRFVTLVMVKRTGDKLGYAPAEWIWSDLFAWKSLEWAQQRCLNWHQIQNHTNIYQDDASLLSCPQTLLQAMADRGRFMADEYWFMADEYSNPDSEHHCVTYHVNATRCFRTNRPSNQGAGQQCCYDEQRNLMVGPPNGGSLDRVHVEVGVPVFSHFFHDLVPYLDCCLWSDNCGKYFEKRPSDYGSSYKPPRPATGFGDPHMITLDGVEYTFNGYGEYHILQVTGPEFKLQGRMQPLINEDGNPTNATVFKAFAMKENVSDVVQVHINGSNEIEILLNGNTVEFDEQLMMDFNDVIVLKYNNASKYSAIFKSGILVTVEKAEDILQIMLLVPPTFKGNTSGLLGFWNGNKEKEFLLPNGTFLDTNSSQTRIHYEFGQKWATVANNSLFTYDEGKSHASYFDVGYVPIFLDQEDFVFDNATLGQQARDVCGDNKQCLFDIHTTGKVSIGRASKQAVDSFIAVINDTETPACVPIANTLIDGNVCRNDTKDGPMIFRFDCNQGFRLNGSSVISCLHGQWNATKPSCHRVCPAVMPVDNGHARGNGTTVGSHYWFICNNGFMLIGPDTIHCGEDGQWNGSLPKCAKVCPPVVPVDNGHARGNGTTVGSRYWFTCNNGFALIGPDTIHCGEDGQWNGSLPKCTKVCPAVMPVDNGHARSNGTTVGSRYWFTCNNGFMLIGPDTIHCGEDGQWNQNLPKCAKVCPAVMPVHNGHARGNGTTVGSRYWFTCNKGFTMIGPDSIQCGEDGHWNGTLPKCAKDTASRTPLYLAYATISVAVVALVTAIIVAICLVVISRRKRSRWQLASQVGKHTKQELSFNNRAYASASDLK